MKHPARILDNPVIPLNTALAMVRTDDIKLPVSTRQSMPDKKASTRYLGQSLEDLKPKFSALVTP